MFDCLNNEPDPYEKVQSEAGSLREVLRNADRLSAREFSRIRALLETHIPALLKAYRRRSKPSVLDLTDSPKMLRETLCVAQTALLHSHVGGSREPEHVARIGRLIDQLDIMRPLGNDGKHGNKHTPYCGCED